MVAYIEIKNLTVVYSDTHKRKLKAIDNVTFNINKGEFVSILGPSGCGKTTIIKAIAGLLKPTKGKIIIEGRPISEPSPERVMVFQDYQLLPWRTVLGNVELGLEIMGLPREERRKIAMQYIELVGLKGFENSYPKELSGGMRQRVGLARALAVNPKIILLDEPFAAVDAMTRRILQQELMRLWRETRKTLILVTHSIEEAVLLSQKIILLTKRPGKVKKIIYNDLPYPRDPFSEKFQSIARGIWTVMEEELGEKHVHEVQSGISFK